MKTRTWIMVLVAFSLTWFASDASAQAKRRPSNANRPSLPEKHLANPFRGKVDNVTPKMVTIIGDEGPTASFVIGPGCKITRDGKDITALQIFKGDTIFVRFSAPKDKAGDGFATEIIVGNIPDVRNTDPPPAAKKKKKK